MALIGGTYGRGGVRVMRISKDGPLQGMRELEVTVMLTGDVDTAHTPRRNSAVVSLETVKDAVNLVARENLGLDPEDFCRAVAVHFLQRYTQVETVMVQGLQTKGARMAINSEAHPRNIVLESNGQPFAGVFATHAETKIVSGISGVTFTKSTQCERVCAPNMEASWLWGDSPVDYSAANAKILTAMLEVFGTTCSGRVQDSLYRMATAALAAVHEIVEASLACPDHHDLPNDLQPFGLTNDGAVSMPAEQPRGKIECTVGRD